jgi:predicted amidohydrolase
MTSRGAFRIAAAQYDVEFLTSWEAYENKIRRWFASAAERGARFLVFPEYFSMELASLFPQAVYSSLALQLEALQELLPRFLTLFGDAAAEHGAYVVAGSFPVRLSGGAYRNRSFFFRPDGSHGFQDKLQMTRFEAERWSIEAGEAIGIDVCYDGEFPMIARKQVEAGATLIVVPSCTDTRAGYYRVRVGAQARALENQCYVVQASTVGSAPWSEAVDENVGAAGVYTPIDYGFPDDGVLAVGELNVPGWVFADIDLARVQRVRAEGQVFNYRDWDAHLKLR